MKEKRFSKKSLINELVNKKIHPITGLRAERMNQQDQNKAYKIRKKLKKGLPISENEEVWLTRYKHSINTA
jgi:hypothetical protein